MSTLAEQYVNGDRNPDEIHGLVPDPVGGEPLVVGLLDAVQTSANDAQSVADRVEELADGSRLRIEAYPVARAIVEELPMPAPELRGVIMIADGEAFVCRLSEYGSSARYAAEENGDESFVLTDEHFAWQPAGFPVGAPPTITVVE